MPAVRRHEITDFEWSIIQPLLPNKARGVPRADDRKVLNGIYWRRRSGSTWDEIPERYGPYDLLQSLCAVGEGGRVVPHLRGGVCRLRWHTSAPSPAASRRARPATSRW